MYNLQLTPTKNTINRHAIEANRLKNLVKLNIITKNEAKILFKKYLEGAFGRRIK